MLDIQQHKLVQPTSGVSLLPVCTCVTLQAADTSKPGADKQLNFQFYRNPAAILADSNQQVGMPYHPDRKQAAVQSVLGFQACGTPYMQLQHFWGTWA